jgi:flagellar motor switch/type III secretory pathway protein FliN
MQRKLARARGGMGMRPGGERPALKALRLAVARSAADLFDLPLAVIDAAHRRLPQEELATAFEEDRLLVLLDGPDRRVGAMGLSHVLVAALIQQQTMGSVASTSPTVRPYTDTDAALVAPLIDGLLSQAVELTGAPADHACLSGYRFGARAEDARSVTLTMEAERLRVFTLSVDICGGLHQGAIDLILPDRPAAAGQSDPAHGADELDAPRMSDAVMGAPAELTAVLCRLHLSLNELAAMKPGAVLTLNSQRFDQTDLITIDGQRVAAGRLGQSDGYRAVRVKETSRLQANAMPAQDEEHADQSADAIVEQVSDDRRSTELAQNERSKLSAHSKSAAPAFEPKDPEGESEILLERMTPEQAAQEISELAGLSDTDSAEPDAEVHARLAAAS